MSYQELTHHISKNLKHMHKESPDLMQSFHALSQNALKEGVLDPKTKEFIATSLERIINIAKIKGKIKLPSSEDIPILRLMS